MKNEVLFNQIVLSDLNVLNQMVSKGWFETTDFENQVLKLSDTLAMFHQAMTIQGGKYDCQTGGEKQIQTYKSYFRVS